MAKTIKFNDYMKAIHRGNREAELEDKTGWNAKHKVHKNVKAYSRKVKHKMTYAF